MSGPRPSPKPTSAVCHGEPWGRSQSTGRSPTRAAPRRLAEFCKGEPMRRRASEHARRLPSRPASASRRLHQRWRDAGWTGDARKGGSERIGWRSHEQEDRARDRRKGARGRPAWGARPPWRRRSRAPAAIFGNSATATSGHPSPAAAAADRTPARSVVNRAD